MRPTRRSWLAATVAAAVGAAAALAYFLLFRSDEAEVLATLDRIARVLSMAPGDRAARFERDLSPLVADDVIVHLDGVRIRGRAQLLRVAADAVGDDLVRIELSAPELRVDGKSASARGDVVAEVQRSHLMRDARRYDAIFERRDGRWAMNSLDIARATHEEPEARP